ncbi:MAG: BMP family ABC transporter substrate-binding protein [Clostridiales bacterium]|nr:BMP family ABC transporter substrate-binding protein [Clostridiales bacterium]
MYENLKELYNDARAKGKKEYNRRKARGKSGHLTSLDGLIVDIDIMTTVDLGEMEIPLKKIKGTYSNFRRMSFSKSFMPLEGPNSEFASKWITLCEAHLDEGIRDPIKVYEYMNFFYVIEGNKRVSVLKHFGASAIRGQILRLIPKYDEYDKDVRLYYRFLEFNRETQLNQLWLSDPNDYDELDEALSSYNPELGFYNDKYKHFYHEVYLPFRKIYKELGGDAVQVTTADAFLLFIKIYDLPLILDVNKTREVMPQLIRELVSSDVEESMEIKARSTDLEKTTLLESFSGLMGKKMKIAFIYAKKIEESGWSYSHELGRLAVEETFKDNIETKSFENIQDDDQLKALIDELVQNNYQAIFTTAVTHRKATLSAALLYDKVKFFNCSGSRPYVHMSSYYGRSFETRFLTGMIAGSMTNSNIIGYTAASPTPDTISCINAYAIGAKMVNPNAIVKVAYTGVWNSPKDNEKKIKSLIGEGADYISSKNNMLSRTATKPYGITSMLCSVNTETKTLEDYLAAPIWKWDVFYTKIINTMLNGSYSRIVKNTKSTKLINFWWGLESGCIDIYMNENIVPTETRKLVNLMKRLISTDQFRPFNGPLKDQAGVIRVFDERVLSATEIIEMDWYVSNVKILDV